MAARIVIEEPCEHGHVGQHVILCNDFCIDDGHDMHGICPGGSRRVLTEGEYVLIEKVDGEWPAGWQRGLAPLLDDLANTGGES